MHNQYLSHKIYKLDDIRIGVFGLGIELNGLVPKKLYSNTPSYSIKTKHVP